MPHYFDNGATASEIETFEEARAEADTRKVLVKATGPNAWSPKGWAALDPSTGKVDWPKSIFEASEFTIAEAREVKATAGFPCEITTFRGEPIGWPEWKAPA